MLQAASYELDPAVSLASHHKIEPGDPDEDVRVINVPWPARDYLERIYVSPYAEEWYRDVVVSVMERFAPDLVDRLTWSRMRGVPL